MGEKDKSTKYLEAFNDVFADIFNVLVFGESYIKEDYLIDGATETQFKTEKDVTTSRYRDCLKQYIDTNMVCVSMGIENQVSVDETMPMRIMGYDYGRYALQLQNNKKISPVISVVLYFGEGEWTNPLSLTDMMGTISDKVKPFIEDYSIRVVNMRTLPKDVRRRFTSDFRVIADHFAEKDNEDYIPSRQELKHAEAVIHMLKVFTNDNRYDFIADAIQSDLQKGKVISMCSYLDRLENRGIAKGLEEGLMCLVATLKEVFVDFDDVYEKVVKNEVYKERTREDILRIYEQVQV